MTAIASGITGAVELAIVIRMLDQVRGCLTIGRHASLGLKAGRCRMTRGFLINYIFGFSVLSKEEACRMSSVIL
jgi:hypothetical protein